MIFLLLQVCSDDPMETIFLLLQVCSDDLTEIYYNLENDQFKSQLVTYKYISHTRSYPPVHRLHLTTIVMSFTRVITAVLGYLSLCYYISLWVDGSLVLCIGHKHIATHPEHCRQTAASLNWHLVNLAYIDI
jgi:hypothetical protein